MSETTAAPKTNVQTDLHVFIADKIIESLKSGVPPWHLTKPKAGFPVNLVTKEAYRGINALLLLMAGCEQNLFLTFDQVNGLGGKVKAGSKGYTVVRWEKPKEATEQAANGDAHKTMKRSTVFNIEQCEIPDAAMPALAMPLIPIKPEIIIQNMPKCPKIVHENGTAYYDVVEDAVHIFKSKKKDVNYYMALLHLLVHSTGNDCRLARRGVAEMGELLETDLYSKEELTTIIATCFFQARTHTLLGYSKKLEYTVGWAGLLQTDKWLIFKAAADAQKAYDYILDIKPRNEPVQKEPDENE